MYKYRKVGVVFVVLLFFFLPEKRRNCKWGAGRERPKGDGEIDRKIDRKSDRLIDRGRRKWFCRRYV